MDLYGKGYLVQGPAPLERAGRCSPGRGALRVFSLRRWNGREPWPARPGPHFLGRNGGKNPRGRRFLPRDPLLWWGCVGGGCTSFLVPGLRPPRPTPHGPPTGSGGREKWFVDGRKKWEPASILSSFSQRVPLGTPPRPQPAQLVGGPLRAFQCEGRRPGTPIEEDRRSYSSPEKRGVGERNSFPRGGPGAQPLVFFPLFLQRNRAPPGRAKFLPVPTAMVKPKNQRSRPPVTRSPGRPDTPPAPD